jgi:hypothetical protein
MGAGQVAPDGTFSIVRVPPGDHLIRVTPRQQNIVRDGLAVPQPGAAADEPEFGILPVSVGGEDVSGLAIQLRRAARITGRVVFEGTSPRPYPQQLRVMMQTTDSQGGIVNQFFVASGLGLDGGPVRQNGQLAADGTFEFRGASGKVAVRVATPGTWLLKSVTLRGTDITDTGLDVADDVDGVRVLLTDKFAEVSGTVSADGNRASEGFAVVVVPREEREGIAVQRYTRALRLPRADRFSVRGLPAGDYVAAAFEWLEPGSEWDPRIREAIRESGERFSLTDGQQQTLNLKLAPEP